MLKSAPGEMAVTAGTLAPTPITPPLNASGPGTVNAKLAPTPNAFAVTVAGPLADPMVTLALAIPLASVNNCAGPATFAEPCVTAKLTSVLARGFPVLSVTWTFTGAGAG